jgi:hypothetical protein
VNNKINEKAPNGAFVFYQGERYLSLAVFFSALASVFFSAGSLDDVSLLGLSPLEESLLLEEVIVELCDFVSVT